MSQNSYNNIKKYAAFIFMVFTVLSGTSDRIDADNFNKAGRKALIDIMGTNKLFAQDMKLSSSQMRRRITLEENEGLRAFLDAYGENSHLYNIQVYIFPLIVYIFCAKNLILKNNIWKSAVF